MDHDAGTVGGRSGGDRTPGQDQGPAPGHQRYAGDGGEQATGPSYGGYQEGAYGEPVLGWIGVGFLVLFGAFVLIGLLNSPSGHYG